ADASLRDFLNATREPYVRSAAYSETLSPGWTLRQWTFSVAGDGRTLDATVLQRIRDDPGGPGGPLDPLGGRDPLRPSGGGSATVESSYGAGAPFPVARGDLPRELPSLPDALRAWRAYRDDALGDAAPNAWGFAHAATCDETGACGYGGTRLEAGLARVDHAQPLQRRSLLALDADGRVVSLDESTMARGPAPPSPAPFVMGGADVVLHPPLREWPLATLWAAGGLLALGAAGAAAWLAATGRLALLPLFSRIERERAADHALRARLLAQVRAEPGLDVAALAARNGVAWSTAMHHVRKLEALGAARTARVAGRRCVYPSAARLTPESLSLPLLRRDATRRVLLAVSERPGALQRDVARRLGLDESTVSHHCRRLEAAGLLEGRASGNQRALYLTPVAQELLTASG
ncbi:MAG TPA: winged helix-turn-helix transcriptional regulator, partial [Candidatus Thermoplasmatota archaeon]|nr:winged helix-turn-helix transcriptional regulator [Candidatus Thermoplasmatota archaeon]